MQLFEADPLWDNTEFKFVSGILPGFIGFLAWSEAGVIDPDTREPKERPVGWKLAKFDGPAEGHAEFRGYYRGPQVRQEARGGQRGGGRVRDVIVIGAGGGGPVVAKELAARGLDVLLLEAGAAQRRPRGGVAPPRERRQQPRRRLLPLRPVRPHEAGLAARAAAELVPVAGRRRRRDDAALLRQQPARGARRLRGLQRARPRRLRPRARVPVHATASFVPVLRVGRAHAAGADRGDGHEGGDVPARRREDGPAAPARRRTSRATRYRPQENAILQPERHRRAGPATPTQLRYPQARGCTFCGFCFQGCYEPRGAPRNLDGQALDRQLVRADGADRRRVAARAARPITLVTDAFVTRIDTEREGGARSRAA